MRTYKNPYLKDTSERWEDLMIKIERLQIIKNSDLYADKIRTNAVKYCKLKNQRGQCKKIMKAVWNEPNDNLIFKLMDVCTMLAFVTIVDPSL